MNTASLNWPKMLPRILWSRECPLCTSISFEEAEPEPVDLVFRCLGFVPVRCRNCWRRYYWLRVRKLLSAHDSDD